MYLNLATAIGERAESRNLTIEQWAYWYLKLTIAVPPLGAVWTTANTCTRARMMVRRQMRDDSVVLTLDSEGVSPKITIDNSGGPSICVLTIAMGALFTGLFTPEPDDGSGILRTGFTIDRSLSKGVYDIVAELNDIPDRTLRVFQGEISLSEQVVRPIS